MILIKKDQFLLYKSDHKIYKTYTYLSNKTYALSLMSHSRGAYTKGSKEQKEFDGTILHTQIL
ncbi:hypothetical protein [Mammaliicoccus vitulinus]|uniref:hypothetical protein n=1 Tax=Mammaliicoccus vitulinus TaxID=71237 RepID=UPI00145A64DF|nr:hypothetical protein [Mammaliicoccus vitulinus]QJF24961.1 hypothetical protein HF021_05540 [Mammaliicoccus vitulinus]